MDSFKATSKDAGPKQEAPAKPEAPSMLSYIRAMMEYDKELMAKSYEECVREGLCDDGPLFESIEEEEEEHGHL